MDVTVEPDVEPAIVEAVRASVAHAGFDAGPARPPTGSAWWRAGVEEALSRSPAEVAAVRYDAARSPRRTRGATRA